MKRRKFLVSLTLLVTFMGGFFVPFLFSVKEWKDVIYVGMKTTGDLARSAFEAVRLPFSTLIPINDTPTSTFVFEAIAEPTATLSPTSLFSFLHIGSVTPTVFVSATSDRKSRPSPTPLSLATRPSPVAPVRTATAVPSDTSIPRPTSTVIDKPTTTSTPQPTATHAPTKTPTRRPSSTPPAPTNTVPPTAKPTTAVPPTTEPPPPPTDPPTTEPPPPPTDPPTTEPPPPPTDPPTEPPPPTDPPAATEPQPTDPPVQPGILSRVEPFAGDVDLQDTCPFSLPCQTQFPLPEIAFIGLRHGYEPQKGVIEDFPLLEDAG